MVKERKERRREIKKKWKEIKELGRKERQKKRDKGQKWNDIKEL